MKKFLFFLLKILIISLLLAYALDLVYTAGFLQSTERDKIGYIYNSKPQKFDVIILGSSRAENHFVSKMFKEKGLKTFNFGMQGSRLFESDLILKLLVEKKNIIKNVIVEVDLNLRSGLSKYSDANVLKFLPYLHNSKCINDHFEELSDHDSQFYIPFYRYMKYETKIGFREFFLSASQKKSKVFTSDGYGALYTSNEYLEDNLASAIPKRNKYYEEIKKICKVNNINLIAVMTPMCENVVGMNYFDKVKKMYPEIHNYENVVVENKYFSSCKHLNDKGARIFTTRILKDFFNR